MHVNRFLIPPVRFRMVMISVAVLMGCYSGVAQTAAPASLSEFQGSYPISIPTYEGVEQLLVLSDRWIVVVTSNEQDVVNEIDKLSGGKMLPAVAQWDLTKDLAKPYWPAQTIVRSLRDQYYALGRINS